MAEVVLRPAGDDDRAALTALLGDAGAPELPDRLRCAWPPPDPLAPDGAPVDDPGEGRSPAVVAEVGGAVVGAAMSCWTPLRPARRTVALRVAGPHRRRGIGTALLTETRAAGEPTALRVPRPHHDWAAGAFLAAMGFRALYDHSTVVVDPCDGAIGGWAASQLSPDVVPWEPSPAELVGWGESLHRRWHAEADRAGPFPPALAHQVFAAQVPGSAHAGHGGDVVGWLVPAPVGVDPVRSSLVWFGADGELGAAAESATVARATAAVAAACLVAAPGTVAVEVDDTHPAGWAVAAALGGIARTATTVTVMVDDLGA